MVENLVGMKSEVFMKLQEEPLFIKLILNRSINLDRATKEYKP